MINKKVFALTLVAASVIAAGCSSDDDDDDMGPAVDNGGEMNPGTDPGIDPGTDPGTDPEVPAFVFPDYTPEGNSVADVISKDPALAGLAAAIPPALLNQLDYDEAKRAAALAAADDTDDSDAMDVDSVDDVDDVDVNTDDDDDMPMAEVPAVVDYTVFAPNNEAITAADPSGLTPAELSNLLLGHVVLGTITAAEVQANAGENDGVGGDAYTTLNGGMLMLSNNESGGPVVNGGINFVSGTDTDDGGVTGGTQIADNGIVHVIDTVIVPSTDTTPPEGNEGDNEGDNGTPPASGTSPVLGAVSAAGNTEFVDLYNARGFGGALDDNPWTVFAPSNDAIDDGVGATLAGGDTAAGGPLDVVLQDHIFTGSALDADALGALTEITTNGGDTYAVATDGTQITVGGFPVTLVSTGDGASNVFSIEGLLPSSN